MFCPTTKYKCMEKCIIPSLKLIFFIFNGMGDLWFFTIVFVIAIYSMYSSLDFFASYISNFFPCILFEPLWISASLPLCKFYLLPFYLCFYFRNNFIFYNMCEQGLSPKYYRYITFVLTLLLFNFLIFYLPVSRFYT